MRDRLDPTGSTGADMFAPPALSPEELLGEGSAPAPSHREEPEELTELAAPLLPYHVPALSPLGEILVQERGLSVAKLEEALTLQTQRGGLLGEALVSLKAASEGDITYGLARQAGLPFSERLKTNEVDGALSDALPIQYSKQRRALPIRRHGEGLVVAVADPFESEAIDDLRSLFRCEVYPVAVPGEDLMRIINEVYDQKAGSLAGEALEEGGNENVATDRVEELDDLIDATDEAPIIRFINSVISEAVKDRASDIHIEPMEREVIVRFRQDGELHEKHRAPKRFQSAIAAASRSWAG